jgi:hypothetical protein
LGFSWHRQSRCLSVPNILKMQTLLCIRLSCISMYMILISPQLAPPPLSESETFLLEFRYLCGIPLPFWILDFTRICPWRVFTTLIMSLLFVKKCK